MYLVVYVYVYLCNICIYVNSIHVFLYVALLCSALNPLPLVFSGADSSATRTGLVHPRRSEQAFHPVLDVLDSARGASSGQEACRRRRRSLYAV